MNQFTSAQAKAIETWTEKRDALLRDIGVYESRLQIVKKDCTEAGLALRDLHNQLSEAKGRLSELNALEERHKNSLSTEVSELEVRKTRLETECIAMEKRLEKAAESEEQILTSINGLSQVYGHMSDQAKFVNQMVGEIVQTDKLHASEMKSIMIEVRAISKEVIEKANENVKQTGIILDKLPRYIFELQKPISVRRSFSVPRGTVIQPDNKKLP